MKNLSSKKTFGALAVLTMAGLALTGCSVFGGGEPTEKAVTADGAYVLAPQDGGLFTLTVAGKKIDVKREVCKADAQGVDAPVIDPRDTAFGELTESGEAEAVTRKIAWLEGGAYTEEKAEAFEILSDGQIVRVGERNFFDSISDQGTALQEQFTKDCTPEPVVDELDTETAKATETPTPEPTESATPTPTPTAGSTVDAR